MASLSSPTRSEPRASASPSAAPPNSGTLVLSCGNPVAVDFADYLRRVTRDADQTDGAVVFLRRRLTAADRATLATALRARGRVAFVSSYRAHLGDRAWTAVESEVLAQARQLGKRVALFRPAHVLSAHSRASSRLRWLGCVYPLVPRRLHGCCVDGDELFASMQAYLTGEPAAQAKDEPNSGHRSSLAGAAGSLPRAFTLLGANRPWRDVLAERRLHGPSAAVVVAVTYLLALLQLGQLAALVVSLLARWLPALRCCNVSTLRPGSFAELLALYNPYNARHVQIVGYNNGVIHFGHRYPGKTVVSTVRCNRVALTAPTTLKADAGATVRQARDCLGAAGLELPVVPNYSYVCLGTSFFVPIHGSAADFSTVAETITRVVLYDPRADRLIVASSDEPAFRDHVYEAGSSLLLLRLYLRVRPRSPYFVETTVVENPSGGALVEALRDSRAANVEIRKSQAASPTATISRYYVGTANTPGALELPRDGLGRLWDRLEENPVTSFLMHALTRHFAWHVELFFTADEFVEFWQSHQALPLKKLQVRYIRRDGWRCSPFRDHDCVSVDLFMLRRQREEFEAYLKRTFAIVRSNPGKHSR